MPEDKNKKVEQEGSTPAPAVSTQGTEIPKIETPENMVGSAKVQGPSESEKAISKTYDDAIGQLGLTIKGLEGRRNQALQQDETAQRRARNMQMIAGISDSLASLANLIGVGRGGTNIDQGPGVLTPLQQRMEAARQERKADIKSIDDRLEQYQRQLDQAKMQKGIAVVQQKEKDRVTALEQARHAEDMLMKRAALAYQKERDKVEDAYKDKSLALQKQNMQNDYNLGLKRLNQAAEQAGIKGSFPVLIGENEMLDIPKNEINNATIGRIFEQLPKEFQELAQGKPLYQYQDDGMGGSVKVFAGYEQPTLDQKLAAIGAAARTNTDVQDELRKLAGTYKPSSSKASEADDDEEDFSQYSRTRRNSVSMDYRDNIPGGGSRTSQIGQIDTAKLQNMEDAIISGNTLFKGKYKRL